MIQHDDQASVSDSFELHVELNTAPVAFDDAVTTDELTALVIDVLGGNGGAADLDLENNILPYKTVNITGPESGQLTNNYDGTFLFTRQGDLFNDLDAGEQTQVDFTYRIEDAFGASATATVSIIVTGVDTDPRLTLLTDTMNEDAGIYTSDFIGRLDTNDFNYLSFGGSQTLNFFETDDLELLENSGDDPDREVISGRVFELTIEGRNDTPAINSDFELVTVAAGEFGATSGTFEDPDWNDSVTISASTGQVVWDDASSGTWSWTADAPYSGPYEVTLTVVDLLGESGTTNFTVTDQNEAPSFESQVLRVDENQSLVATLVATDRNLPRDVLSFALTDGGVDNALFEVTSDGVLSFLVLPDFEMPKDQDGDNSYELLVEVRDALGAARTAEISVEVQPINDNAPAFLSDDQVDVPSGNSYVQTLVAGDNDSPSQRMLFSILDGADADRFGIVNENELRFLTPPRFDLPHDENGDNVYEVEILVYDSNGLSATQQVQVRVIEESFAQVQSVQIDNGSGQRSVVRSLTVAFDQPVTLGEDAFLIEREDGELFIPIISSLTGNVITLTFDDQSGNGIQGRSLPEGNYVLTIFADLGGAGSLLEYDYTEEFHRFYGDSDGNRIINGRDLGEFLPTYQKTSLEFTFNEIFDIDGNEIINGRDLGAFLANYQQTMPAASLRDDSGVQARVMAALHAESLAVDLTIDEVLSGLEASKNNDLPPKSGDANSDGKVDFEDFLILANHFGNVDAVWAEGDFDGDTQVRFEDFLVLSKNFGR